jgi:YbbR domain-containing protein
MEKTETTGRVGRFLKILVRGLKHLTLHNGGFKLLALLLSIVLWAGVISQDETLTRDKSFSNVSVSVTGADTMRRNGYIVTTNLDELLSNVSIVAAVPQRQYENAEASTYNVRLDLSRISSVGTQELRLLSTNSATYGRVINTNPSSITVNVEEYFVRQRIPVSITVDGDMPYGWYMSTPTVDPNLIAVSGPRSLVSTISRARVFVRPSMSEWVEGTLLNTAEIKLYNLSGEEVNSNLLTITSESTTIDSVLIEATILPTKAFDVADMLQFTGDVESGYEVSDIRVSPETITVAARSDVLSQLEELPLERTINISGINETTVYQLKVQKPSEDAVLSNETVTVTVEISAEEPAQ